jgi:hypothetical protein
MYLSLKNRRHTIQYPYREAEAYPVNKSIFALLRNDLHLTETSFKPHPFMKQRTALLQVTLCIGALFFSACKSTKVNQKQTTRQNQAEISICDQTIKYYSELIKMTNGQPDVNINTEITINPSTRILHLSTEEPEKGKGGFDTVIESIECNLNAGLTEGQAIYNGYIKQEDGNSKKAKIKVEAKDGSLTISNADAEKEAPYFIVVSKWEIVKE